jgi:hypothetical protein
MKRNLFTVAVTTVLTLAALVGLLSVAASADEDAAFDGRVTFATEGCVTIATFHPSGRTLTAVDNLGRTVGPIDKPETATLEFTEAGWIDVTLQRDSGNVTRRFTVPGPPEDCGVTTTTTPDVTTTTQRPPIDGCDKVECPPNETTTTQPDQPTTTIPGQPNENGECGEGQHDIGDETIGVICAADEESG